MKFFAALFVTILNIQSAYALTTVINGTTYSCEPDDSYPPVHKYFYCTIESTFDGSFGGSGRTELEARIEAKKACKQGSTNEGFFCKESTIQCDSSN